MVVAEFVVHGIAAPQGSKNQFGGEANPRTKPWRAAVTSAAADVIADPVQHGPLKVAVIFTFPRPKSHYRTGKNAHLLRDDAPLLVDKKPDTDKLQRAIGDALTGTAFRDDSQIAWWEAVQVYGPQAHTFIRIETVSQEDLLERMRSIGVDLAGAQALHQPC